jgi:hypothetical protein
MVMLTIDQERFFAKTKRATEARPGMATPCLEWMARRNHKGYGQFRISGKTQQSHRVAWEFANGPVPDGMRVLHRCDNPPCVDEEHFFLGTDADNYSDMVNKGRDRKASGDANGAYTHPESRPRGEDNGFAKLKATDVLRIFSLRRDGMTLQQIADVVGISNGHTHRVLTRKVWAHVQVEGNS